MAEKLDQVYTYRENPIFLFDLMNFIKNPEREYKSKNFKVARQHNKVLEKKLGQRNTKVWLRYMFISTL